MGLFLFLFSFFDQTVWFVFLKYLYKKIAKYKIKPEYVYIQVTCTVMGLHKLLHVILYEGSTRLWIRSLYSGEGLYRGVLCLSCNTHIGEIH